MPCGTRAAGRAAENQWLFWEGNGNGSLIYTFKTHGCAGCSDSLASSTSAVFLMRGRCC